ncbi:hypothetical protein ACFOKJ_03620 [Vogesella amnigena]|uniref:Transposase n=1 Tax=Vogesella amnigena TaxID=1507449 RepID=A0ABV7TR41_9NEIS
MAGRLKPPAEHLETIWRRRRLHLEKDFAALRQLVDVDQYMPETFLLAVTNGSKKTQLFAGFAMIQIMVVA